LKFCTLEVAEFMLFAKLYMAAAAAIITAMPTPVKARNVAKLMFKLFCTIVANAVAAEYTFWAMATPALVRMNMPITLTTIMAELKVRACASFSKPNWLAM
jgi:hypothetical protein